MHDLVFSWEVRLGFIASEKAGDAAGRRCWEDGRAAKGKELAEQPSLTQVWFATAAVNQPQALQCAEAFKKAARSPARR
jgi:hypothetical protein